MEVYGGVDMMIRVAERFSLRPVVTLNAVHYLMPIIVNRRTDQEWRASPFFAEVSVELLVDFLNGESK